MRTLICLCFLALTFTATSQDSGLREVDLPATLPGVTENHISLEQAMALTELQAPANHRIASFTMIRVHNDMIVEMSNDTYQFNSALLEQLPLCEVGDKLYFERINAQDAKGEMVRLPFIKVEITE